MECFIQLTIRIRADVELVTHFADQTDIQTPMRHQTAHCTYRKGIRHTRKNVTKKKVCDKGYKGWDVIAGGTLEETFGIAMSV